MHQQNTMNEEYKLIIKKFILNNIKRVVLGFHRLITEEADLLSFALCGWVISSRLFERK
jgi:hypothetical protein